MDLNLLKTFDVVIKTRSVNEAANTLGITAPAVSHALNRLREEYQDRLFIRQGRGIVPTSFALELHAEIQAPLELLMNSGRSNQTFNPAVSQRSFRISSHKDIDLAVVPRVNNYCALNAPYIQLKADIEHLNEEDRQTDLRTRKVDFILATVPLKDHGYHNHLLFEQTLVIVTCKNHPRIKGNLSYTQFFAERHLQWGTKRMNNDILSSLSSDDLPPRNIAYLTSSICTAIMMAAQTDWLCLCSEWHAAAMSKHLEIETYPLPFELKRLPIYMTWHHSQQTDSGHQWLKEAIIELTRDLSSV